MAADDRNEAALGELAYVIDPIYRDLSMESVYEYGTRAGTWRLQRLLDQKAAPTRSKESAGHVLRRGRRAGAQPKDRSLAARQCARTL